MFNIGPLELIVLAIVGLVVLGPEKLPGLARDAARMIRTLRELATGARQQLRDELGPEFADVDLRNLNPRHAISKVLLGDEFSDTFSDTFSGADLRKYDPRRFDARQAARDFLDDDRDDGEHGASSEPVNFDKPSSAPSTNGNGSRAGQERPRPRPAPGPRSETPYDSDAT